jgi:hypothetical protein
LIKEEVNFAFFAVTARTTLSELRKKKKTKRRQTPALFDTVHKERSNNENEAGLISQLRVDNTAECSHSNTNGRCTMLYQWSSLRKNRMEEEVIEPKPCGIAEQEFPILGLERGMTDEMGGAW